MRHEALATLMAGQYTRLSDVSGYVRSPLTMASDGTAIGAYVLEASGNRLRITDDADLLFHAMVNGVPPTAARAKQFQMIAEQCGLSLSEDGELHVVCEEELASYYLARFMEAADRISYLSVTHRAKPVGRFERRVGDALDSYFPDRVAKKITMPGASGHNLKFPFVIDRDSSSPVVIQPVAATEGRLDWGNVYQALGKFTDLKNNRNFRSKRIAVLEAAEQEGAEQAKTALAETANVVVFQNAGQLADVLRAA